MLSTTLIFSLLSFSILIDVSHQSKSSDDERTIIRTMEKLSVHSEVANLRRLFFPSNISEKVNVDFSLAKRDEFPYFYFLINHSSRGILTIRKEIDRDDLCRRRRCRCDSWCDLELEILINGEVFNIEIITIRILDRNDHQPRFPNENGRLNLTIVENAPIGASIKLESAVDHDQGHHGIVAYSLVSSKSLPFSLRYDLLRSDLSLIIEENLDREMNPSYEFEIVARDGENQTGSVEVFVTIDDVNDNAPKFLQAIYEIRNLSENFPVGNVVCRVEARDEDFAVNGELSYHLVSNSDEFFEIDAATGEIRLVQPLDFETKQSHRLEVEARDFGEGSKTDLTTVFIELVDENDNAPSIEVHSFYPKEEDQGRLIIFVNETTPKNSLILSIFVVDRDSKENGRVSWKIDGSSIWMPFDLIRLTETSGEIRSQTILDREIRSNFDFSIEATDAGLPNSKTSRFDFSIRIIDVNDNAPKFRWFQTNLTVNEDFPVGREILRAEADDQDENENAVVVYSILDDKSNFFRIDEKNGIIRTRKNFDRKVQSQHVFQIEAKDRGTPSLATRTTIFIEVAAPNKFSPRCEIDGNRRNLSIRENVQRATVLTTIRCDDADEDPSNRKLTFSVHFQNFRQHKIPFQLETMETNRSQERLIIAIKVNGTVDRELVSNYSLIFTVTDQGNPARSTNISLDIDVLDENDNCPQLHLDSSLIVINRDRQKPQTSIHLQATDQDENFNGKITFELSSSPSFVNLFSNGTLVVDTESSAIQENTIVILHIQIRDHGEPTPCLIIESLRLFIGTNQTDWNIVMKNYQHLHSSTRPSTDPYQQGKRMVQVYSVQPSTANPSPLFQYPASLSLLSNHKQLFILSIGSIILMFIILSTMVLCFVDCLNKRMRKGSRHDQQKSVTLLPVDVLNSACSASLMNGKPVLMSQENSYYQHLTPKAKHSLNSMKPVLTVSSSNSHSASSVDSMTRANTVHNRNLPTNSYTYTPLSTNDDYVPNETDNRYNRLVDENGVEFMMTTV